MTYYPDETQHRLRAELEFGWDYMKQIPDGREKNAVFDRWLVVLGEYTARYGAIDLDERLTGTSGAPVVQSGLFEEGDL